MAPRTLLSMLATAALAGCFDAPDSYLVAPGSDNPAGGSNGPTNMDGIPCDVADLLTAQCAVCHGATGARPMMSLEQLLAPSQDDPSRSVGELAADYVQGIGKVMPPGGLLPAADVAPLVEWVAAGMPAGDCQTPPGTSPFDAPPTCTSDAFYSESVYGEGPDMHPGMACNSCHVQEMEAEPLPIFTVAGTVYPTGHEPDDCLGASAGLAGAVVEITDANGGVISLPIRDSGNFLYEVALAFPVAARVVADGKSIAMSTPIDSDMSDCNGCHTQNGDNGAPGRIILPP